MGPRTLVLEPPLPLENCQYLQLLVAPASKMPSSLSSATVQKAAVTSTGTGVAVTDVDAVRAASAIPAQPQRNGGLTVLANMSSVPKR